jgi:hypothetical protein
MFPLLRGERLRRGGRAADTSNRSGRQMSIRDAFSFCDRMSTDEGFGRRAAAAVKEKRGPAASATLVALGSELGLSFTAEELVRVGRLLTSANELSADDLTGVVGGASIADVAEMGADTSLQDAAQRQSQTLALLSNIAKTQSDTTRAVIRKIGG